MQQGNFLLTVRKMRTKAMKVAGVGAILALLFTRPLWPLDSLAYLVFQSVGYLLVVIGALGRLWCIFYIAGRKCRELVTAGPYAMCRNPLYVFSFAIGLGATMIFQNLIVLILFIVFFIVFHTAAVTVEEGDLGAAFGEDFQNYCQRVPRFFPKVWNLSPSIREVPSVTASTRHIFRGLLDTILFLLIPVFAQFFLLLYQKGILPLTGN